MEPLKLTPMDYLAAAHLLQRYAWASDQRDRAGLGDCFTTGAAVWLAAPYSQPVCVAEGRDWIVDWVIERHREEFAAGHLRRHLVAFPSVTAQADHLLARSYFTVLVRDEDDLHVAAMGWLEDELVLEEETLRIRLRCVHIDAKKKSAKNIHKENSS